MNLPVLTHMGLRICMCYGSLAARVHVQLSQVTGFFKNTFRVMKKHNPFGYCNVL